MIKKLIYILITFIIFITPVLADTQSGYLEYSGFPYRFNKGDDIKFLKNAEKNMQEFYSPNKKTPKEFHLQEAMRYYFLLSQARPDSVEAQIGLGRIYDEMNLDRLAKKHFFNAYNFNSQDPKLNMYFANFYYKRNEFITALGFYNAAHKYGYSKNYFINWQLGTLYEKLGDIEGAKHFFKQALKINPQNQNIRDKISSLNSIKK